MVSPSTSPDEERKRQNWRDYFDRGERYDVPYLPERWNAIVRRNVVTAVVMIGAAVLLVALLWWWGRLGPFVLGGVLALVMVVYALMALHTRHMLIAHSGGEPGLALGVSDEGLHTPVLGTLPWSEVIGVFLIDESRKVDAVRAQRGLQGAAARFAAKNGAGSAHINVVLPDGKEVRRRIETRSWRRIVQTWAHHDAPMFGVVSFTLDQAVAPADMTRLGMAIIVQGERHPQVDVSLTRGASTFAEYMMRKSNVFDYSNVDGGSEGAPSGQAGGQSGA